MVPLPQLNISAIIKPCMSGSIYARLGISASAILMAERRDTMTWYERMNKAVDYIEDHLCGEIDFNRICKIVSQSPVNFQRTF